MHFQISCLGGEACLGAEHLFCAAEGIDAAEGRSFLQQKRGGDDVAQRWRGRVGKMEREREMETEMEGARKRWRRCCENQPAARVPLGPSGSCSVERPGFLSDRIKLPCTESPQPSFAQMRGTVNTGGGCRGLGIRV